MPRRMRTPIRWQERDLLSGGGAFDTWSGGLPIGWALITDGTATGTVTQETNPDRILSGASSARVNRTGGTGRVYLERSLDSPLIPTMWYRIRGAYRRGVAAPVGGLGTATRLALCNHTQSTSLNGTGGAFAGGLTNVWGGVPGVARYFVAEVWFQVPAGYGASDDWRVRAGLQASSSGDPDGNFDAYTLLGPYQRPVHAFPASSAMVAWPHPLKHVITLKAPWGEEFDITKRVELGGFGTLTEGAEEQFLRLTHGDLTLTLDDRDRVIRGLLAGASRTDRWELIIVRDTGRTRGMRMDRLFAGVLDLPWSLVYKPGDDEVKLQVFSYSKLVERASAEGVRKTFSGTRISTTAAAKTFTMDSTTGLQKGDSIRANNGTGTTEEKTVDTITSGTAGTVTENWTNAFAGVSVELLTPYHRWKSPAEIAGLLFDQAGVVARSIRVEEDIAPFPIMTMVNPTGSHGSASSLRSVVEQAGQIVATASVSPRRAAASARSGFSSGTASTTPLLDWRPYLLSEPGTIHATGVTPDTGLWNFNQDTPSPDHTGARSWILDLTYGGVSGERADLNLVGPDVIGGATSRVDSYVDVGQFGYSHASHDYDPVANQLWASYRRGDPGSPAEGTRIYDLATDVFINIIPGQFGQVRCCRPLNAMMWTDGVGELRLYELGTRLLLRSGISCPASLHLWTFRAWDDFAACLYTKDGRTRCVVFDSGTWETLSDFPVAATSVGPRFLTVFADPTTGKTMAVGYVGPAATPTWFVLAPFYAGVIPYANFAEKSCAAGLREVATITVCRFDVDRYNVGRLIPRGAFDGLTPTFKIEAVLSETRRPIWEFYRRAVKVTGEPATGNDDVVGTAGDTGDSSLTEPVDAALADNEATCAGVAAALLGWLGVERQQADIVIQEHDELLRPFEQPVEWDGLTWVVAEAKGNTPDQEQTLKLFEAKG